MKKGQDNQLFLAVTGMHRSGTSLLSGLLSHAGVWFGPPEKQIKSNQENPTGFFERSDVRRLNDQLLHAAGCDWSETSTFKLSRIPEAHIEAFESAARPLLKDLISASASGLAAIKEPRLCLLMPLWMRCIDVPVVQIIVHRPAEEVALSLKTRNNMPERVAYHLYQFYLASLLRGAEDRHVFITDYQSCLAEPVATLLRLQAHLEKLGISLPELDEAAIARFSRRDLYRSRAEPAPGDIPKELERGLESLARGKLPDPTLEEPAQDVKVLAWEYQQRFGIWQTAQERALRLRDRLDRVEVMLTDGQQDLDKAKHQLDERRSELDALNTRCHSMTASLKEHELQKNSLENDLAISGAKNTALSDQLKSAGNAIAALESSLQLTQESVKSALEVLESRDAALREARQSLEAEQQALESARKTETDLRGQLEQLVSEHETRSARLNQRIDKQAEKFRDLQAQYKEARRQSTQQQRALEQQREKNHQFRDTIARLTKDRDHNAHTAQQLREQIRVLVEQVAEAELDNKRIKSSLSWRFTSPVRALLSVFPKRWFTQAAPTSAATLQAPPVQPAPVAPPTPVEPLPPEQAKPPRAVEPPAEPARISATALVITWDIGHNPLGRSYMLADVLERVFNNVIIVGFRFERYGKKTWEPLRNSSIPVIGLRAANFPEFLVELERVSQRVNPDIVFACKPRLPSLQLGAMIRQATGCPMVLDIDDHELTFFKDAPPITLEMLENMGQSAAARELEPYNAFWTRCAEDARRYADALLVSNPALEKEFGGVLVPHVRNEKRFDPDLIRAEDVRDRLRVPHDARVVLFFGTPRRHKGIDSIARAVGRVKNRNCHLVIVGKAPDRRDVEGLHDLTEGRLILVGNQPFESIPDILSIADVVCLPQDPKNPISQFQLPAKAIDAVAMNVPLIVSDTPPLRWLADLGLATLETDERLDRAIEQALDDEVSKASELDRRQRFLDQFSYQSAARSLHALSTRLLSEGPEGRKQDPDFQRFLAAQRNVLGIPETAAEPQSQQGLDVVVFWKQNDSRIYGRRVDMIVKLLAQRDDVRRVLVFDMPASEFDLAHLKKPTNGPSHNRRVYEEAYRKMLGQSDKGKISYHVFIHPPGIYDLPHRESPDRRPLIEGFLPFVESTLRREGVQPDSAVFWIYPRFYLAEPLIEAIKPLRVVVDVVDDHREWPNTPEREIELISEHYSALLARADLALVNCEPMERKMKPLARGRFELIPNGCDSSPPCHSPPGENIAFTELSQWDGPVIGYVGNLEAKIDVALIEKVALAFPDAKIMLIGSTHATDAAIRLSELSNVTMPGVVPYQEVGAWLQHMDVAMVPHLHSRMTENMNPLKVFVYLQWGVPVVSTSVQNIGYDGPMITVAGGEEEFINAIGRYLETEKSSWEEERLEFIRNNDWSSRFTPLLDEFFVDAQSAVPPDHE